MRNREEGCEEGGDSSFLIFLLFLIPNSSFLIS